MARGDIPREKKKLKGKKKSTNRSFISDAPVFVLPRIIEKRKRES